MKAYFIGSGIGALAGAAFLVRDAGVDGHEITIFEKHPHVFGGALDGARLPDGAYSLRGGRMLTTEHYECTWALLDGIPDLAATDGDGTPSVRARTLDFNKAHVAHSQARLIDRHRHRIDVRHMGFSMANRLELVRLLEASEERLGDSRISDWLSEAFFETNFWHMWQTTFAFQPWHSAVELKRYLHRFINEFPRIETLAGVKRTIYNQYDAIVRPLIETGQLRSNALGAATAAIFFTCAVHHGGHTVHMLLPGAGVERIVRGGRAGHAPNIGRRDVARKAGGDRGSSAQRLRRRSLTLSAC